MTTPCQLLEQEGMLDPEREQEALAHIEECPSCRLLWEEYRRILEALPSVGASHRRRPDYKARLEAAITSVQDKK